MPGTVLRFPKMVEMANPRLIMLYALLQVIVVGMLMGWFVNAKFWEEKDEVGKHIRANLWVTSDIGAPVFQERAGALNATICRHLSDYVYWYDSTGNFEYEDISCLFPCMPGQTEECVRATEAYIAKGDNEVFLATHQEETLYGSDGQALEKRNSFLMSAEGLAVHMTFFYDMPQYKWDGSKYDLTDGVTSLGVSSLKDIRTVALDAKGEPKWTYPPGPSITLTVPQLLELSGNANLLDDPKATAGVNHRPGAAKEPPPRRLSGLELAVHIECNEAGLNNAICHMAVRETERGWIYEYVRDYVRPGQKQRVSAYHGLRVVVVSEGRQSHFALTTLISKLTSCLVILTLPRRLVLFVCITMLGHLSRVYRQAIIDRFNLQEYMAGMSARLLVWNTAFVELVDHNTRMGESFITRRRMHERLKAVLHQRGMTLDAGEVNVLVEYCYEAILKQGHSQGRRQSFFTDISSEFVAFRRDSMSSAFDKALGSIDCDKFSVACTSNEHINYNAVVALFDRQRQRWFLERLFTPKDFSVTEMESFNDVVGDLEYPDAECIPEALPSPHGDLKIPSDGDHGEAACCVQDSDTQEHPSCESSKELTEAVVEPCVSHKSREGEDPGSRLPRKTPVKFMRNSLNRLAQAATGTRPCITLEEERDVRRSLPRRLLSMVKEIDWMREQQQEVFRTMEQNVRELKANHRRLDERADSDHRCIAEVRQVLEEHQKATKEQQDAVDKRCSDIEESHLATQQQHRKINEVVVEVMELQQQIKAMYRSLEERLSALQAAGSGQIPASPRSLMKGPRVGLARPSGAATAGGGRSSHRGAAPAPDPVYRVDDEFEEVETPQAPAPLRLQPWRDAFQNSLSPSRL